MSDFPDKENDVPEVSGPPASSILGQLGLEIGEQVEGTTKTLPVGGTRRLACKYRALPDEERDEIRDSAEKAVKLARRVGKPTGDATRIAQARMLATACVELLYVTPDGGEVPLGEALRGEGVDCPPALRYDRDLVAALGGQVAEHLGGEAGMVEIVTYLHRNGESTAPLETAATLYETWAAGVTASVIQDIFGDD